jgi:hypothetical protein
MDLTRTVESSSLVCWHEEVRIRRCSRVLDTLSVGVVGSSPVHFDVFNDTTGVVLGEFGSVQFNLEAISLLVLDLAWREAIDFSHASNLDKFDVVSIFIDIVQFTSA